MMEFFTVENSKEAKQTIEQIQSAKDDVFVLRMTPNALIPLLSIRKQRA